MDVTEAAHRIRPVLERAAMVDVAPGEEISLLYSGGLDSSLLAWLLLPRASIELVTVGSPGSDDIDAARSGAALLGLPWREVTIGSKDVERVIRAHSAAMRGVKEPQLSVAVSLALALGATRRPKVLCGQGADELFLGYAHFEGLSAAEAVERRRSDLDLLNRTEWPRAQHIAAECERELFAPYLDTLLVAAVDGTPVEPHLPTSERKPVLREIARDAGLPAELADRPKKAMQYGSGVNRLVRARSAPRKPRAA
ncbi:MAG: asparagine synthase-related protein [Thermoplasmata archaeon]|nr:asparagine synthase-related protein [Thermoplasmata archaeon]